MHPRMTAKKSQLWISGLENGRFRFSRSCCLELTQYVRDNSIKRRQGLVLTPYATETIQLYMRGSCRSGDERRFDSFRAGGQPIATRLSPFRTSMRLFHHPYRTISTSSQQSLLRAQGIKIYMGSQVGSYPLTPTAVPMHYQSSVRR